MCLKLSSILNENIIENSRLQNNRSSVELLKIRGFHLNLKSGFKEISERNLASKKVVEKWIAIKNDVWDTCKR